MKYFFIVLGAGTGAVSRYLLSNLVYYFTNKVFPIGTLVVNLLGCFVIGLLYSLFEKFTISPNVRLFIFVGLLGGFTTFSSFGMETFNLLKQSEIKYALLNLLLSNVLGVLFVFAGYMLIKLILKD